jgi:MinD superfamily P-loop ATPase
MKQLLILSGKGGTGKTTIAGAFIKFADAKVFGDCDVDAPNLHLVMDNIGTPSIVDYYGLPKAKINQTLCTNCGLCKEKCRFNAIEFVKVYSVNYYSCEGCGVCELICPANAITLEKDIAGKLQLYHENKVFSTAELKMGHGTSGMLVSEVKKQMLNNKKETEVVIIDGSPGIGCPVIASISGVDMVLIVSEPSLSGISDMKRIIKTCAKFKVRTLVCINKYDINLENTREIEDYCLNNNIMLVGKIPYDNKVIWAINNGLSIADIESHARNSIREIYQKTIKMLKEK